MIKLQTLENISLDEMVEIFNLSFSDYIVPFHLTKEQLIDKIKFEHIDLHISAGAFINGRLVGFILHGYNIVNGLKLAYNAGTGVIPTLRGNKLTIQLYEFILPFLKNKGIDKIQLEVITENKAAIQAYQYIGFTISRKLSCYKGSITNINVNENILIKKIENYDWQIFQQFWDIEPTWQNAIPAVEEMKSINISLAIYKMSSVIGYLIFNPKTNKIHQFAIDKNYRGKGLAQQLFQYISIHYTSLLAIINVDDCSSNTNDFIRELGLSNFANQYEMEFLLNK